MMFFDSFSSYNNFVEAFSAFILLYIFFSIWLKCFTTIGSGVKRMAHAMTTKEERD